MLLLITKTPTIQKRTISRNFHLFSFKSMDFIRKILPFHPKSWAIDHSFNQQIHTCVFTTFQVLYGSERQPKVWFLPERVTINQGIRHVPKSPRMVKVPHKWNKWTALGAIWEVRRVHFPDKEWKGNADQRGKTGTEQWRMNRSSNTRKRSGRAFWGKGIDRLKKMGKCYRKNEYLKWEWYMVFG